jgi:poly-gamma-glutamate capsule biosynthesis protein CapA/YwtB (metallophosphatase superfamily)
LPKYHPILSPLQKKWAQQLVEAGVDVIAGHGPHVVQNEKIIEGIPVFFSLGNFVFDQRQLEETQKGLAVRLIYEEAKLIGVEKLPLYIDSQSQPEFINEELEEKVPIIPQSY